MRCLDCGNWVLARTTRYEDGSEVVNYSAPEGKGHCDVLGVDTAADFGCTAFVVGGHVKTATKSGSPWSHWTMVNCPDCQGKGSAGSSCHRCAGTGNVRRYDDGHVGEERTRMHPKEKELRDQVREPAPDPGTILQKLPAESGALTGEGTPIGEGTLG